MTIGKKLTLMIVGIIAVLIIGITAFIILYLPTTLMRMEKDQLFMLDSSISELRADINKIPGAPFAGAFDTVIADHQLLSDEFERLDGFTELKKDPKIAEAIDVMIQLNSLYESNYVNLYEKASSVKQMIVEVFYSANVEIYDVATSPLVLKSPKRNMMEDNIDKLYSSIEIIDNNLISTHNVVQEQFNIINKTIEDKEMSAYKTGIIIILAIIVLSLVGAIFSASRIAGTIRAAGDGVKKMSSG